MTEPPITGETTVAEALRRVPNAVELFQEHGIDPTLRCGLMTRIIRIRAAQTDCGLRDCDSLIAKLNAALG